MSPISAAYTAEAEDNLEPFRSRGGLGDMRTAELALETANRRCLGSLSCAALAGASRRVENNQGPVLVIVEYRVISRRYGWPNARKGASSWSPRSKRMRAERPKLSRHAEVAKAIHYMLTRWPAFTSFLDNGRICLSNNSAERALRGLAPARHRGQSYVVFTKRSPDYRASIRSARPGRHPAGEGGNA
jgi:Transposase IS66 family